MSEVKNIQVLALAAIEEPDSDAYYRRICRWYSREFSTPLDTVINDIPEREVLVHYYEDLYYNLYNDSSDEGQMRYFALREAILKTDKEVVEEEYETEEDDDWANEMIEQIRQEEEAMREKHAKKAVESATKDKPNLKGEPFNVTVKGE